MAKKIEKEKELPSQAVAAVQNVGFGVDPGDINMDPEDLAEYLAKLAEERAISRGRRGRFKRATAESKAVRLYDGLRDLAFLQGVPFTISFTQLRNKLQAGVCDATGLPLVFNDVNGTKANSAVVIRQNDARGFTPGNTKLVVHMYAAARGKFPHGKVMAMARALVEKWDT